MRANRFLQFADELFSLAPIRGLRLLGTPAVVDELAASPHLRRLRSLALVGLDPNDELTDDMLARLLGSPHLENIVHIGIARQGRLTPRAFEMIATAPTLPRLSYLELENAPLTCFVEPIDLTTSPGTLSYFERVIQKPPESGDPRDTPKPVEFHPDDWIVELERKHGYAPCLHPWEHYGRYVLDLEAVMQHPVALDPEVAARRGQPVSVPGPKPSIMERRSLGLCALCGSSSFTWEPGTVEPYSDPQGSAGIYHCKQCGTGWYADQWPEKTG